MKCKTILYSLLIVFSPSIAMHRGAAAAATAAALKKITPRLSARAAHAARASALVQRREYQSTSDYSDQNRSRNSHKKQNLNQIEPSDLKLLVKCILEQKIRSHKIESLALKIVAAGGGLEALLFASDGHLGIAAIVGALSAGGVALSYVDPPDKRREELQQLHNKLHEIRPQTNVGRVKETLNDLD